MRTTVKMREQLALLREQISTEAWATYRADDGLIELYKASDTARNFPIASRMFPDEAEYVAVAHHALPDLLVDIDTLRDQVATLTAERDAAREALKPFAAYASYHTANSQIYILEWDSTIPFQAFVNASAVLATPPRLDSEGARLPFALADDSEVTDVFADVAKEMDRQVRKWGVQRHEPTLWIAILLEEVGEVAKAALEAWHQGKDDDPKGEQYRTELVHVMAVAASAVRSLEMNNAKVQA